MQVKDTALHRVSEPAAAEHMIAREQVATGHLVTALVNGCPVGVQVAHRWAGEGGGPALLTLSATLALTTEEVTAVLFDWLWAGVSVEELADPHRVRSLVAETIVNEGCSRVDTVMATAHTSGEVALLVYCHQRALAVFGHGD